MKVRDIFDLKLEKNDQDRHVVVILRLFGLDFIAGAYGYITDWAVISFRVPNGPGATLQVGPFLVGLGRYL